MRKKEIGKDNNKDNNTVVVITSGLDLDAPNFLQNIIKILLSAFSGKIYVIISGVPFSKKCFNERVHIKQIMHENETGKPRNSGSRIVKNIVTQLKISYVLAKERKAEAYIFFLAQSLTLPILTLKLMRRKVILALGASCSELAESKKDRLLLFLKIEEKISYKLSNHIIVYSPNLTKEWNLEKYRNKIHIAHEHFLDFDKLTIKKKIDERENLIGYVGRLSEEKGVLNFVKAIPEILKERDDLKFLIGGDGQLRDEIEKCLEAENLDNKAKLSGWIPHDKLPDCLNELKLVVLPSYTEGLPNIMLEAMACGTPVLATPVGAILDVIKDGETGFIMENNSPECVAENVIMVLEHSNIDIIVKNARLLVEREFTYETAVDRYRKILENLGVKNHE